MMDDSITHDADDLYAFWCPFIYYHVTKWSQNKTKNRHFLGCNYAENSIAEFRKVSRDIPNYLKNESQMFVSMYETKLRADSYISQSLSTLSVCSKLTSLPLYVYICVQIISKDQITKTYQYLSCFLILTFISHGYLSCLLSLITAVLCLYEYRIAVF